MSCFKPSASPHSPEGQRQSTNGDVKDIVIKLLELGNHATFSFAKVVQEVTMSLFNSKQNPSGENDVEDKVLKKLLDIERTKAEKLERVDRFIEEHFYPIAFDDLVFPKESQAEILHRVHEEINKLDVLLSYPWMYGKLKVAFAGKFSSGKSSIINALLGEDTLPTAVTPTTALPTQITYIPNAGTEAVYIIDRDGKIIPIGVNLLKEIKHEHLDDFQGKILQYIVDLVVISHPSKILKDNVIIDTPGYNPSSNNIDRELSLKALKESDLIFWVMDIEDGDISKDALELIKEELVGKELYVIVNKADRKPPSGREKVKKKVTQTLRKAGVGFRGVFLFSSREKDDYISDILDLLKLYHKSTSSKGRATALPLINFLREHIQKAIDVCIKHSKRPTDEELEEYVYKNILEPIWQGISKAFQNHVYRDDDNDFVYIEFAKFQEFWNKIGHSIENPIYDFIYDLQAHSEIIGHVNENWKKAERLLGTARKALKELDRLQEDIERTFVYL